MVLRAREEAAILEQGRPKVVGAGRRGALPLHVALNLGITLAMSLCRHREMLSPCPLLFLAIVYFLLVVAVRILRRPFLHTSPRKFEIVWENKAAVAPGRSPKVTQKSHPRVREGEWQLGTAMLASK